MSGAGVSLGNVQPRDVTPEQVEQWTKQAAGGDVEAAWSLALAQHRVACDLGLWREEGRTAAQQAQQLVQQAVDLGGAAYAWQAVELAFELDDAAVAGRWTRTATSLQCPPGSGVQAAADFFVPAAEEGGRIYSTDATVLVQCADREAATAALEAAGNRLGLVNPSGHEYASLEEAEEHWSSLPAEDEFDAYTVSYVSDVEQHELGPWLSMDDKGACLSGPMASTMLGILVEELQRAGAKGAVLRSARFLVWSE